MRPSLQPVLFVRFVRYQLRSTQCRSIYSAPLGASEFRLLRLTPDSKPGHVKCDMQVFDFRAAVLPKYFTLSYVWGKPTFTEVVTVNRQQVLVTPNLLEVLETLHMPVADIHAEAIINDLPSTWFWVDGICINQADQDERGKQVRLMSEIYSNTSLTFAWLGPRTVDSFRAISLIEGLSTAWHNGTWESVVEELFWDTYYAPDWIALDSFFNRSWWQRIWIRQECILPPKYILVCGDTYCGDLQVAGMASCLDHATRGSSRAYATIRLAPNLLNGDPSGRTKLVVYSAGLLGSMSISRLRNIRSHKRDIPFLELLQEMLGASSTDERDQLYGIMGLASDAQDLLGTPDYTAPVSEILERFVQSYVQHYRNLDVICFSVKTQDQEGWPSWVPNLLHRDADHNPLSAFSIYGMTYKAFTAAGIETPAPLLFKASGSTAPIVTFSSNTLTARGILVDRIDGLGWICDPDCADPGILQSSSEQNTPKRPIAPDNNDMDSVRKALWRTLVANRGLDLQFMSPPTYSVFQQLCLKVLGGQQVSYLCEDIMKNNRQLNIRGRKLEEWIAFEDEAIKSQVEYPPVDTMDGQYLARAGLTSYQGHKRLMVTASGYIGLAPYAAQKGDLVCVMYGCSLPLILRKTGEHYRFIGEAYLDDFMDGEAIDHCEAGTLKEMDFDMR